MKSIKIVVTVLFAIVLFSQCAFARERPSLDLFMYRDDPGLRTRASYGRTWVKEFTGVVVKVDTTVKWNRFFIVKSDNGDEITVKIDRMTDYRPSWAALKEGARVNVKADSEGYASYVEVLR